MDKIFTNVLDLLNAVKGLNANPVAIIPSYIDEELITNHSSFNLECDCPECYCCFYFYDDYEGFKRDVAKTVSTLDLTEGADDRYYDYNPSCFESLLYAAHQLPALEKAKLYQSLLDAIKNYKDWLETPEGQDAEVIDQYDFYLSNIENDTLEGLEGYEIYKQLKQL